MTQDSARKIAAAYNNDDTKLHDCYGECQEKDPKTVIYSPVLDADGRAHVVCDFCYDNSMINIEIL